jgi:hypothetical protein
LAKNADASLICAMRDVSRVDQVRRTYDRLLGAEANPVGVVLNGIPTRNYAYRYGGYGYIPRKYAAAGRGHGAAEAEAAEMSAETDPFAEDTPLHTSAENDSDETLV